MAKEKASLASRDVVAFSGFPQAGIQFLRDLKKNNDREWFREKKELYEKHVRRPMELLVTEAAAQCRKRGLMIYAQEKNPVMRIYRDIRFSPDKSPFKTNVGAGLKSAQAKASYGEVYIHVSPEESFVAAGFWMPERPFLQAWRESITQDPRAFLRVVKSLAKSSLKLSAENGLNRLPRGYDQYADSEIAGFLKLTSYVTATKLKPKECQSRDMLTTVCDFALAAKPLLEYGWKLNYTPRRDILEER